MLATMHLVFTQWKLQLHEKQICTQFYIYGPCLEFNFWFTKNSDSIVCQ